MKNRFRTCPTEPAFAMGATLLAAAQESSGPIKLMQHDEDQPCSVSAKLVSDLRTTWPPTNSEGDWMTQNEARWSGWIN